MRVLESSPKPSVSRWSSLITACLIILLLLLVLTLYTFLHEGGHALVGLLYGGKITSYSVNFFNLSAHVGIDGTFSPFQNALIAAAGAALPVLVCMYLILFTSPRGEAFFGWFKLIFFGCAVNALLAWIVIPVLVLAGKTPSDDSVNFLHYTHLPPLLVTGAALLIYLACWWMLLRHMGGFRGIVDQLRGQPLDVTQPATRKSIGALAALGVVIGAVTIGLTQAMPARAHDSPPGYQKVAEVQVTDKGMNNQTLYTFHLDQPTTLSLFLVLEQIKGGPFYIYLTGPGGYENLFLQINDPQSDISYATVNPRNLHLEKGDYAVRAIFERDSSSGRISVYVLRK